MPESDPIATFAATPKSRVTAGKLGWAGMSRYSIRNAEVSEQRDLMRLCVRATLQAGYDQAFIDRCMPGLTVTVPLIAGGGVHVAERKAGEVVGMVAVMTTVLAGIALLYGLYVEPAFWRCGVGRMLFQAAATRTKGLDAGALMIYAEPSAEGFYKRMGAIRIGEGPFYYSPEIILPRLLFIPSQHTSWDATDTAAT